jgi:hypothetical protein
MRERRLGMQASGHRRRHLQHIGKTRDREQLRHGDRTERSNTAEIVAQQVDNHQIFGAILGIGG